MIKILTVVGARPQIIKAAAVSRALKQQSHIQEILVHTGQHYDAALSDVFFRQLQIPKPKYNLNVGSSSHGRQTALMLEKCEAVLQAEKPDAVIIYGDTNSTLAGALSAVKLKIPVAHVEAGLRSYNLTMPEEINRIVADQCATWLFAPTQNALDNLENERLNKSRTLNQHQTVAYFAGDVMYDNFLYCKQTVKEHTTNKNEILITLHRDFNTDNKLRLQQLIKNIEKVAEKFALKPLFPLHPRTKQALKKYNITLNNAFQVLPPLDYFAILKTIQNVKMVITDSGGLQKEAFWSKKPTIILRPNTEWTEIQEAGCSQCVDDDTDKTLQSVGQFLHQPPEKFPNLFGDGKAAIHISNCLKDAFT